jgi:hypothetical protein
VAGQFITFRTLANGEQTLRNFFRRQKGAIVVMPANVCSWISLKVYVLNEN